MHQLYKTSTFCEEKGEAYCNVAVCVHAGRAIVRADECRMLCLVCEVEVRSVEHYRTSSHA